MPKTDEVLLARARAMRGEMTQPERELWTALRGRRFAAVKFARQVVIGSSIVDFVARSAKLVVEVDGGTHSDEGADVRRTARLEQQGYRLIRFANSDVMGNLEGVLHAIGMALAAAPLPTLSPEGRGLSHD